MPHDWRMGTVVPIYKQKGSVMDCASYRGVKLLEHGMKVVERLLEKRLRRLVKVDQMQFGFMPGRSTWTLFLFLGECRKATLRRIGSFLFVLLIWRRLLIGCQES